MQPHLQVAEDHPHHGQQVGHQEEYQVVAENKQFCYINRNKEKEGSREEQAGAEMCQAQVKLELSMKFKLM